MSVFDKLEPVIKGPFTDLLGTTHHYQRGPCADFELQMMNCLESYGLKSGQVKCADYMADFKECVSSDKKLARLKALRLERLRQYQSGELLKQERYMPAPPKDSY